MWKTDENCFCLNLKNEILNLEKLEDEYEKVKKYKYYGDVIWPDLLPHEKESINLIKKINNQLIKNNEEYSRFASDYVHCLMCDKVYDQTLEKGVDLIFDEQNWEIIEIFKLPISDQEDDSCKQDLICYGVLFINKFRKQMVLAYRGFNIKFEELLNEKGDLILNIKNVLLKEYVPQLAFCYHVTKRAYDFAKDFECYLSFTGYANGAWLAEHSIYFFEKELKTSESFYDFNFQVDTKAVLFDSPGMLKNSNENIIIDPESSIDQTNDLFIVNYLTVPNLANSSNKHSGLCYRLIYNNHQIENKKIKNLLKSDYISSLKHSHLFILNALISIFDREKLNFIIENFFDKSNPSNNQVINCERVAKWPLVNIEFESDYEESFVEFFSIENFDWTLISDKYDFVNTMNKNVLDLVIKSIQKNVNQHLLPGVHILPNLIKAMQQSSDFNFNIFENDLFYKELKLTKQQKLIAEEKLNSNSENNEGKSDKKRSSLFDIYSEINGTSDDFNFNKKLLLIRQQKSDSNKKNQQSSFWHKFTTFSNNKKERSSLDVSSSEESTDEKSVSIKKHEELLEKIPNAFVIKINKSYKTVTRFENFHVLNKKFYMDKILNDLFKISNNLKKKSLSSIVFSSLTLLTQLYKVSNKIHNDQLIYVKNNNNDFITLNQIKELFTRIKYLYPDLDKYIDQSNENKSNSSLNSNLFSYLAQSENYYVKKTSFDQIDEKLFKEKEKRCLMLFGESGIGKMTLASEYANYLFENHNFIIRRLHLNSVESIVENYVEPMTDLFCLIRQNIKATDNLYFEFEFERISQKLFDLQSKILFIINFDPIENDKLLEKFDLLLKYMPENVYTLITSEIDLTQYENYSKNITKIELNLLRRDEANNLFQQIMSSQENFDLLLSQQQIDAILNLNELYSPLQLKALAASIILTKGLSLAKIKHYLQTKEVNNLYRDLIKYIFECEDLLLKLMFKISLLNPNEIEKTFLYKLMKTNDVDDLEKKSQFLIMLSILKENKENEKLVFYSMHKILHKNLKHYIQNTLEDEFIEKICNEDIQTISSLIDKKENLSYLNYMFDYLNEIFRLNFFKSDNYKLSEIFFKLGFSFVKSNRNQYKKAAICFDRSLESFQKSSSNSSNYLSKLGFIYLNIGFCSYMNGEYDQARDKLVESTECLCKSKTQISDAFVDKNFLNKFLISISKDEDLVSSENDDELDDEYYIGKFYNIYMNIVNQDSINILIVQSELNRLIGNFLDNQK